MVLTLGSRLGPYQIVAPIGAGGMGEVYRARDTRLARDVAIKVLPAESASDPDRRARFEQEARAASALNHPNVVTVHDIDSADGSLYIAMEYVEGRTLREVMAAGPIPIRKLLDIATQIAEGLAKAHDAGIVHRDLKPDNVMVTRDGFVKVLDFGLAKLAGPIEALSDVPTRAATSPGAVLGTVGYMSPEQAAGRAADFRSDQFALGAVLYEMASGKRAFRRATGAETLAAIIRDDPEDLAASPTVPAPLRWIIERCLAKDPEERFASTRDLARDLAAIRDHLSETTLPAAAAAPAGSRRRWLSLVAAAAIAAGALAVGHALGGRAAKSDVYFEQVTFRRGAVLNSRFTPDGQTIVYGAAWDGAPPEVFAARLGSPESRSLGLPPGNLLAVSSSGELALSVGWQPTVGWESVGTLARVSLAGGAPREVLEGVQDADWTADGSVLAAVRVVGGRARLEFPVGTAVHETGGWVSRPRISPDGRRVAFFDHPYRGDSQARLAVVEGGAVRILMPQANSNAGLDWSPSGDNVWIGGRALRAVSLEGVVRRLTPPGPVLLQVHDAAPDGRVLVTSSGRRREIAGLAPGEAKERNLTWLEWSFPNDLSADGRTLLFEEQNWSAGNNYMTHLRKTDGSPAARLGECSGGSLSPDGRWVLCMDRSPERSSLKRLPTGAGEARTIPTNLRNLDSPAWFPDGERILVAAGEGAGRSRLFVIDTKGTEARAISPEGVSLNFGHSISPDGSLVAASSHEGRLTLYRADGGEPRPVPGAHADDLPIQWSSDGRRLFVRRALGMPVAVETLDVATGERKPFRTLIPSDPAGVLAISPVFMTADGSAYVYSYRRNLETLHVVHGLR